MSEPKVSVQCEKCRRMTEDYSKVHCHTYCIECGYFVYTMLVKAEENEEKRILEEWDRKQAKEFDRVWKEGIGR